MVSKERAPILEGSPKKLYLENFSMRAPGESAEEFIARMFKQENGLLALQSAIEKEQGE